MILYENVIFSFENRIKGGKTEKTLVVKVSPECKANGRAAIEIVREIPDQTYADCVAARKKVEQACETAKKKTVSAE